MESPPPSPAKEHPPTHLLDLPNELLLIIAESLLDTPPDTSSLNSLLQTNRRLAFLLTPRLHKLAFLDRPDGTPALHWAALSGYVSLADLLLTEIAPELLARRNSVGQNALHVALEQVSPDGDFAIISSLIHHDIPINAQNATGETALQLAVLKGYEPLVKLLLAKGADITILDAKGQTVLHVATRNWGNCGSTAVATLLLDAGINIDVRNHLGETALHKAVLFAHTSMVSLLLARGAITSISDNWWGGTPLHWAADMGKSDIGKLLLAAGAQVSARDFFKGGTPLHWAAKRLNEEMLQLLLRNGADLDLVDNEGKKAFQWSELESKRWGPRELPWWGMPGVPVSGQDRSTHEAVPLRTFPSFFQQPQNSRQW